MNKNQKKNSIMRYVGDRDPSRGGLCITETSEGFPEEIVKHISRRCLEHITTVSGFRSTLIYHLGEGLYAVSIANRVNGTATEHRSHDVIEGIVVDEKILNYLLEEEGDDYLTQLTQEELLGFANAVKTVVKRKAKVQLQAEPEDAERIQRAIYRIVPNALKKQLFVIANGECTLTDANILITPHIRHQKAGKYTKMTLQQFVDMGIKMEENDCLKEEQDELKNVVADCMDYIKEEQIPEQIINQIRDKFIEEQEYKWIEFQKKLRFELEQCPFKKEYADKYMKLLYLAYENYHGECTSTKRLLLMAPYDLEGMVYFLSRKSSSGREFKYMKRVLLEVMGMEYEYLISGRALRRIRKKVEDSLIRE